jgi:hypothetical protein
MACGKANYPMLMSEMHDRLIALAAKRLGATIVTKGGLIQACEQVKCLW